EADWIELSDHGQLCREPGTSAGLGRGIEPGESGGMLVRDEQYSSGRAELRSFQRDSAFHGERGEWTVDWRKHAVGAEQRAGRDGGAPVRPAGGYQPVGLDGRELPL